MKSFITILICGLAMLFSSSIGYADPSVKEKSVYEKVVTLSSTIDFPVIAINSLTKEGSVIDVDKLTINNSIIFNLSKSEIKVENSIVKCKFDKSVGLPATILSYSFERLPDYYLKHPHSEVKYTLDNVTALPYNCTLHYRQCRHNKTL